MSPLVALSAILVIGCAVSSNANQGYIAKKLITLQYRQKRAIPLLIAEKSGGKGEGKPPPELETLMNTPVNTGNLIEASMSGPLVVIGGILIILSLAMAISYQQVNFTSSALFLPKINVQLCLQLCPNSHNPWH